MTASSTLSKLALASCLALALACAGCGHGAKSNYLSTDDGKVAMLLSNMGDASKNSASLKRLFTADATIAEADRAKYQQLAPVISGPIRYENNTATIPVTLKDEKGQAVGQKEWTAVKEGEVWKLKSAPVQ